MSAKMILAFGIGMTVALSIASVSISFAIGFAIGTCVYGAGQLVYN
jgi:hypothetical protein